MWCLNVNDVGLLQASTCLPMPRSEVLISAQMSTAARLPVGIWQTSSVGGNDSIDTVPCSRWDLELGRTGSSQPRARFGGWLQAIDAFDSSAFGITAPEADLMDPQQRLLLEVRHDQSATNCHLKQGCAFLLALFCVVTP